MHLPKNRSIDSRPNLSIPAGSSKVIADMIGPGSIRYAEIRLNRKDVRFSLRLDGGGKLGNTISNIGDTKGLDGYMSMGWWISKFDPVNDSYTAVLTPIPPLDFFERCELIINNTTKTPATIYESEIFYISKKGEDD